MSGPFFTEACGFDVLSKTYLVTLASVVQYMHVFVFQGDGACCVDTPSLQGRGVE